MKNLIRIVFFVMSLFLFNVEIIALQTTHPNNRELTTEKGKKIKKEKRLNFKKQFSSVGKKIKKRFNDVKDSVRKWKHRWIVSLVIGTIGGTLSFLKAIITFKMIYAILFFICLLLVIFSLIALVVWLTKLNAKNKLNSGLSVTV